MPLSKTQEEVLAICSRKGNGQIVQQRNNENKNNDDRTKKDICTKYDPYFWDDYFH